MKKHPITALRERLGLTREQLAAELGVDPATVWRWEAGKVAVSRRTMIALDALRRARDAKKGAL